MDQKILSDRRLKTNEIDSTTICKFPSLARRLLRLGRLREIAREVLLEADAIRLLDRSLFLE